jgi:glycosyltransferase involved in cell wall biosynthesis
MWLSHSANLGGAELALAEAIDGLSSRGHEVHVVLPKDGVLQGRLLKAASVTVLHWNAWVNAPSRWAGIRWLIYDIRRAAPAVAAKFRHLAADVIVTNTVTVPVGGFAAWQARTPHLWFLHEFGTLDHRFSFLLGRRLAFSVIDRLSTIVAVNSEALRRFAARRIRARKLRVVRYAVDVPEIPSKVDSEGTFRLVLCGFKSPGKGQAEAIQAVSILARRGIPVELELIGGGDVAYEGSLRNLSSDLGVADRISFVPFQSCPFELIARADVALMCSVAEAFGRVTVEAMKLGKPVIGAAAGATAELVRPGWNGLLYRSGDPEHLAEKIATLWHDRVLTRDLGEQARRWARETFTLPAYTDQLEAALTDSINESR